MEEKLTAFVIELNRRGRPPTRGEIKLLGSTLSTIPRFGASKGWLDKYISRAQEDLKDHPDKTLFNVLPYSDLTRVEANSKIVDCLIDMRAPENIVEAFKRAPILKPEALSASGNSEDDYESLIKYPDDDESVYLGDDDVFTKKLDPLKNTFDSQR